MRDAADSAQRAMVHTSFTDKLRIAQRRRLFNAFTAFRGGDASETTLCVSMAVAPLFDNTNCLWEWSSPQERARIAWHEIAVPRVTPPRPYIHPDALERTRQPDNLRLPYADGEFDWTFCSEVIERMGTLERQYALVRELTRVSRKGVFLATSNRWHPIEFNTGIPFAHWLPDAWWRNLLRWAGKSQWAADHSFRLVDSRTLYKLASLLPGKPQNDVGHKRVFGIKAHFFLMVEKHASEKPARKVA